VYKGGTRLPALPPVPSLLIFTASKLTSFGNSRQALARAAHVRAVQASHSRRVLRPQAAADGRDGQARQVERVEATGRDGPGQRQDGVFGSVGRMMLATSHVGCH